MDGIIHKQGKKYNTEEERRCGYLAAQLKYATKKWKCEICKTTIMRGNKSNHLKSKKHIRNQS